MAVGYSKFNIDDLVEEKGSEREGIVLGHFAGRVKIEFASGEEWLAEDKIRHIGE